MSRTLDLMAATAVAFVLAGCVTFEAIEKNIEAKYVGQPLDNVIQMIGYPSREMTIAGHKLYLWETQNTLTLTTPTSDTSTGYAGTTPVSVTTYGNHTETYNYHCTLKLEVDDQNVVVNYDY